MKISEMELPQSLYKEVPGPDGRPARLVIPEKLLLWAEEGRGDAIFRLCHEVHDRKLARIDAWERKRIRELEEALLDAGNNEVMGARRYGNVRHYHTTREAVIREAELKRVRVKEHMLEHRSALENLVREARELVIIHQLRHENGDVLAYLMLFVTVAIGIYSVVT